MYSPSIIKRKLDIAQNAISLLPKPQQFTLKLYTLNESILISNAIEEKWRPSDDPKDKNKINKGAYLPLSKLEQQFIRNERIVSQNNFRYWSTRYAKVLHWDGHTMVRFKPYTAQRVIIDVWGELEEREIAIVIMQLKARQLGASTLTELAMAHRVQFLSNRNALVASSDTHKTREMAAMMERAWDNQPHFMQESSTPYESGQRFREFHKYDSRGVDISSSVSLQHGNKLSGIARGKTPSDAHISEIPDFSNPEEHIEASLFNAMHENPGMFIVLESTAKGKTGDGEWWYKTWCDSKEKWAIGESDIYPIFLPYFMGTEIYPTRTWLKKILGNKQIRLDDWKPNKRTIAHSISCARYVKETPYLTKALGKNWKLPKEQQFWWEFKYNQAVKRDTLAKFLEECPANDMEAFQNSGRPIFSTEFIMELNDYRRPIADYQGSPAVFKLIGNDVSDEHEPESHEIDSSREPIPIVADWSYGKYRHEYLLMPVHHNPAKWQNRLFIYEFPFAEGNYEQKYANGIDCGDGIEQDNTVICTVKKGAYDKGKPAHQVAEFASPSLIATALFPWAEAIGTYYSHCTDEVMNQCRQAIEVQRGGNDLQYTFIKSGWSNFHEWEGSYDNARRRTVHKLGWETNYWARGMLIAKNIKALKDWYFRIHSTKFIEELAGLQKGDGSDRIEGEEHDDFIFAGFIAFFSLHVKEIWETDQGTMAKGLSSKVFKPTKADDKFTDLIKDPYDSVYKMLEEINRSGKVIGLSGGSEIALPLDYQPDKLYRG